MIELTEFLENSSLTPIFLTLVTDHDCRVDNFHDKFGVLLLLEFDRFKTVTIFVELKIFIDFDAVIEDEVVFLVLSPIYFHYVVFHPGGPSDACSLRVVVDEVHKDVL